MNTTASAGKPTILLTFDVEDWFQVENFKAYIPFSSWEGRPLRVWKNTLTLLDLLDQAPSRPRATFFILGWVARKVPGLVRVIQNRGHEIASHGLGHGLCRDLEPGILDQDLRQSKALLEDIIGQAVLGYRAPSFSISPRVLDQVRQAGYRYDSSYNNFGSHGRYGHLNLDGAGKHPGYFETAPGFFEIPVSNLAVGGQVLPLGGGGYFRLLPLPLFRRGMTWVLAQEKAFVFYAHPWEVDPFQPRVHRASLGFRFRHYVNLGSTAAKLQALLASFSQARFATCRELVGLG